MDEPLEPRFADYLACEKKAKKVSQVDGMHYSAHANHARSLLDEGRHTEAEALLKRLVKAVEAESKAWRGRFSIASAYHGMLAEIYRREGRYAKEVAIHERYERFALPVARGKNPQLDEARELLRQSRRKK